MNRFRHMVADARVPFGYGFERGFDSSAGFGGMTGIVFEPPGRYGNRDARPDKAWRTSGTDARQPKLLDRVREALRARHYIPRTEETYVQWIRRYVRFHNLRHPAEMGELEINTYLTHLAIDEHVSASTQNQALSALLFLYRHVIGREVGDLGNVVRARTPVRLPVVLTTEEVRAVLANLSGDKWLIASLLYGAGLRLMECLRLRVQDMDFSRNEIRIRHGKGVMDRITMLPTSLNIPLQEHLKRVKAIHACDLADGWGIVLMPDALDRKYPNSPKEWRRQWVFPRKTGGATPRPARRGVIMSMSRWCRRRFIQRR